MALMKLNPTWPTMDVAYPTRLGRLLENNILTIQGEKEKDEELKDERVRRYERTYGAFERTLTLPATIDPNKIVAKYEAGLLTIVLPKVEAAKPKQITVKIEK